MSTRIYVACLAAYNNGKLHGEWIEVSDPDTMQTQIQAILAASPEPGAEEWAIHDHEGFGDYQVSEYASLETLCQVAEFIEEAGEELAGGLLAYFSGDIEEATEAYQDRYQGVHDSLEAYAEQLAEDCGDLDSVPERYRSYIDFAAMGRDMEMGGDIWTIRSDSGLHVFWSH